jgi:hypothetical protein
MPAVVTFDGANKIITEIAGGAENTIDVVEIYSEWKVWVATSDNSKYLQAFTPVGGDEITLTESLGITYFLENGWRIRPAELSHKLTLVGNLFTREPGESAFVSTVGAYTVSAETRVSNLISTLSVGSGLSPTESTRLLELWQRLGLDPDEDVTITDSSIVVGGITLTISQPSGTTTVTARS